MLKSNAQMLDISCICWTY